MLEGGNEYLIAELYNLLTDAYVGLAGQLHESDNNKEGSEAAKERDQCISSALVYVERANEGKSCRACMPEQSVRWVC